MSTEPDYYSEDIPAPEDENEILEAEPVEPAKDKTEENSPAEDEILDKSELVDNTEVVTIKSRSAFENQLIRSIDNIDFGRNRGYNVQEVHSSRAQTIARIRSDLLELELSEGQDDIPSDEVQELKERLSKLSLGENQLIKAWRQQLAEKALGGNAEGAEVGPKADATGAPGKSTDAKPVGVMQKEIKHHNDTFVLTLESRLKTLEYKLGLWNPTNDITVQDEINDIYKRVNLLRRSKKSLSEAQAEFDTLSKNLEEFTRRSRRMSQKDMEDIVPLTDKKINTVYESLQRIQNFEQVVPLMERRLQAINNLVMQTAGTVTFLGNMEDEFSKMETQITNWNTKMDDVAKDVERNQQQWQQDRAELEKLIQTVEAKKSHGPSTPAPISPRPPRAPRPHRGSSKP